MMWQPSVPSNQTTPTHQHNLWVEDSPSDPLELLVEETLEYQEEYPQEVAEEMEEEAEEAEEAEEEASLQPHQHSKQLPMEETNSSAICRSHSQEIAHNLRRS